jgi:cob(I)alamin adenosyltransferase
VLNDLFDLGGDLALPAGSRYADQAKRILPEHVARLETLVESSNARLTPLTSFILPGGSRAAALLHVARTVVRRAERSLVTLRGDAAYAPNPECLRYLNRLSDLCFIWARRANDDGRADMLWRPGASVGG